MLRVLIKWLIILNFVLEFDLYLYLEFNLLDTLHDRLCYQEIDFFTIINRPSSNRIEDLGECVVEYPSLAGLVI